MVLDYVDNEESNLRKRLIQLSLAAVLNNLPVAKSTTEQVQFDGGPSVAAWQYASNRGCAILTYM